MVRVATANRSSPFGVGGSWWGTRSISKIAASHSQSSSSSLQQLQQQQQQQSQTKSIVQAKGFSRSIVRYLVLVCTMYLIYLVWIQSKSPQPAPLPTATKLSTINSNDKYSSSNVPNQNDSTKMKAINTDKEVNLVFENLHRETIHEIDVLWQEPPQSTSYDGILFVAHGCSHSHTDFWPGVLFVQDGEDHMNESDPQQQQQARKVQNPVCPECLGLPEERAIVRMALMDWKLVVVAISSYNRQSKCWTYADNERVVEVLTTLRQRLLQQQQQQQDSSTSHPLPIFAFGASSGGGFVTQLIGAFSEHAQQQQGGGGKQQQIRHPFAGYISQIAGLEPPLEKNPTTHLTHRTCAVYITMDRDTKTDTKAAKAVQAIQQQQPSTDPDASRWTVKHIRVPPLDMDEDFFAQRIPFIAKSQSVQMMQALSKASLVAGNPPRLVHNPRRSTTTAADWRHILRPFVPHALDTFAPDQSPVSEVMNVAYGMHEMTRDGVAEALRFCLDDNNIKVPGKLQQS